MSSLFKNLSKELLSLLTEQEILKNISIPDNYPDEPQMYRYGSQLLSTKQFSDGHINNSSASGFSFFDKELALLKCLVEAAERFCTMCYRKKDLVVSTYGDLKKPAINPAIFPKAKLSSGSKFQWSVGINLITREKTYIPAQLIYYTYLFIKDEPRLTELNSTGAAGGFEKDITILRGIYEIIERDAFMTMYLAKLPCPPIDLGKIKNANVQKIVTAANRYNLEIKVFDITNDLKIPSFMGMVIDRTGLGPCVSFGLKSSLNPLIAILGCMEEAFHSRPWARSQLNLRKSNKFKIKPDNIRFLNERLLFWLSPTMLQNLTFLTDQPTKPIQLGSTQLTIKTELQKVLDLLNEKKCEVFFVDTTLPQLKKSGFFACKIIIPQLQPLYLNETTREVRVNRLKNAALYKGIKKMKVNTIPHPFL